MKKYLYIILIFLFQEVSSQNPLNIVDEYSIDTTMLKEVVLDIVKNNNRVDNNRVKNRDDYRVFIFYYFLSEHTFGKEDYLNYSFLKDLKLVYERRCWGSKMGKEEVYRNRFKRIKNPSKYYKRKSVLEVDGYTVTDSNGIIYGCGHLNDSYFYNVPIREKLVFVWSDPTRFLFNKQLDYILYITNRNDEELSVKPHYFYLYGINLKEKRVYIIVNTRWGAEMFPLEEIINNHWDDFQNGLTNLYYEVSKRKEAEYMLNPE